MLRKSFMWLFMFVVSNSLISCSSLSDLNQCRVCIHPMIDSHTNGAMGTVAHRTATATVSGI